MYFITYLQENLHYIRFHIAFNERSCVRTPALPKHLSGKNDPEQIQYIFFQCDSPNFTFRYSEIRIDK